MKRCLALLAKRPMSHQITPTPLKFSASKHTLREYSTPAINLHVRDLQKRPAARVLVIDPQNRVLLFEYNHKGGDALTDKGSYYTVPGGGVDPGESFEICAKRELKEETGLTLPLSRLLATRQAPLLMPSGKIVLADEQYFAVYVNADQAFDSSQWTTLEQSSIAAMHWCSPSDLRALPNLWPRQLDEILASAARPEGVLNYQSQHEQIGDCVVNLEY